MIGKGTTNGKKFYICSDEMTILSKVTHLNEGELTMKMKPKMHNQEDYELDNIYNDEDVHYDSGGCRSDWPRPSKE